MFLLHQNFCACQITSETGISCRLVDGRGHSVSPTFVSCDWQIKSDQTLINVCWVLPTTEACGQLSRILMAGKFKNGSKICVLRQGMVNLHDAELSALN